MNKATTPPSIGSTVMLDMNRQVSVFNVFESDGTVTKLVRWVDENEVVTTVAMTKEAMEAIILLNDYVDEATNLSLLRK